MSEKVSVSATCPFTGRTVTATCDHHDNIELTVPDDSNSVAAILADVTATSPGGHINQWCESWYHERLRPLNLDSPDAPYSHEALFAVRGEPLPWCECKTFLADESYQKDKDAEENDEDDSLPSLDLKVVFVEDIMAFTEELKAYLEK